MKINRMKAAILTGHNRPLVVDQVELPENLDFGQVLVKVSFSGICGSQVGEISGIKGYDPYLPHLLGHEGSGTVVETGPHVGTVKEGDHVVMHWRPGRGIESRPPKYKWRGNTLNAGYVTTFNEYAVVSENRLTSISKETDRKESALFGCAVTTGFGVIENNARLRIGESLVIFGAGGIGLNMVQAAALVSAHPIIAVDLYDNRLELASQIGATHIINGKTENAKNRIVEIVGDAGLDVFIDNTGQPRFIEMGYQVTKQHGRVILVGVPEKGETISINSLPMHFGKYITGSHGGEVVPQDDILRYHRVYQAKRLSLKELVTECYPLDEINVAISDMMSGKTRGRCMIRM